MQVNTLLLDFFYQNPQLNFLIPDNPLKLQDTLRKSLKRSNFSLLLNGVNVLDNKMDALFFQIHNKFCKKNTKQSVIDILDLWQKSNSKFKISYDNSVQSSQKIKRISLKPRNTKVQQSLIEGSKSLDNYSKFNQKQLQKSLVSKPRQSKNQIKDGAVEQIVSNFFVAVNKHKNHKDPKVIQNSIKQLVSSFIRELDSQNVPFDIIISKLQEQIPFMKLNQQTKSLLQNMIRDHKKHPKRTREQSQIVLRNLLYQVSNPSSNEKIAIRKVTNQNIVNQKILRQQIIIDKNRVQNTATQFTRRQSVPIMTTHTLKVTKKQSESTAKIRRLKLIFQSFSLANKNRKGLTFDQLTEEFKKMDLNNWMNFNKKYNTISKLGIEEVHMIFKRFCHLSLLDYPRFQKAFKDLSKQLFPQDITQAYVYFNLQSDDKIITKSKIILPSISKSTEHRELKQIIIQQSVLPDNNKSSIFKNNKSFIQSRSKIRQKPQNSFQSESNNVLTNSVQTSFRGVKAEVVSSLQNRIKKLKTKI